MVKRLISPHLNPADFIASHLSTNAFQTTLIICSSRDVFLQSLHKSLSATDALTVPTLSLLSTSRNINLAFCPSIAHLRAYTAVFGSDSTTTSEKQKIDVLAVLGCVALHRENQKWSAQSVGRTLAGIVEAAERIGAELRICEIGEGVEEVWGGDIPLLDGAGEQWAEKKVPLRRVVGKWIQFPP